MEAATKSIAKELAPELDKLLNGYLADRAPAGVLYDFLWDNKVGILRVLQAVAREST